MIKHLITILSIMVGIPLTAQSLIFDVSEESGAPGSTVELAITVEDFDSIISLQFSINWEVTIAQFMGTMMPVIDDAAIGEVEAEEGKLRYSWFDIAGDGVTLMDGDTLLTIQFLVVGEPGEETEVAITGNPLAIQVYKNIDGNYEPTTLIGNTGAVLVTEAVAVNADVQTEHVQCFGGENGAIDLFLTANTNDYTIQWNGPNGFNSMDEDLSDLAAGDYQLIVLDANNEILLDTTFTIVEPLSELMIDQLETDLSNCGEADGSAMVSVNGGTPPYSFDFGQGTTGQPTISDLLPGTYSFTVTDANQCGLTDSYSIDSTPLPEPAIDGDFTICEGDIGILEVGDFAEFQWSTGEFSPSISVENSGAFSVTVTNEFGCTAAAAATVEVNDQVALEIENDVLEICSGESFQLLISGGDQYNWIDSSGTLSSLTISNPVATPNETTTYFAIASNSCGSDTVALELFVNEPTGWTMNDTCIAKNTELQLHVGGGKEYQWEENLEYPLNAYNIYNPKSEPEDNTFYVVSILDNNDCVLTDTVFVAVASNPVDFIKAINTITPNGDGQNDLLDFDAINKFGPNRLTIFNRWGDIVYEKVNYQRDGDRFDATKNGKKLPAGTYYYVLSFVGGEEIKQTLLIVR